MTSATWKCANCGHEMEIYISEFIPKCPRCSQTYLHLATLLGLHIAHTIPLYIKEGEDKSKFRMAELVALTTGSETPTLICHDKEFYEFLNSIKSKGNMNEKSAIFFNKNKYYIEEKYWIDEFYSLFEKHRGWFCSATKLISKLQLNILKEKVNYILKMMSNTNLSEKCIDTKLSSKTGRVLYGLKRKIIKNETDKG